MKKITFLLLFFILSSTIVKAQLNQRFISRAGDLYGTGFPKLNQMHPVYLSHPASISWKWDTVLGYNLQGIAVQRLSQTFDANGIVLTQLTESTYNNSWVNSDQSIYSYDSQGRTLGILNKTWQVNAWQNYSRLSVIYNPKGEIGMETLQGWYNNNWVNYLKRNYTYDAAGNQLTTIQQFYQNGTWENDMKFTYGSNTILVEIVNNLAQWVPSERYTYSDFVNGEWLSTLYEQWENSQWVKRGGANYSFDGSGNLLSETYQNWLGSAWINDFRSIYTYDGNGNGVTGKNETWQSGTWAPAMEISYVYNKKNVVCVINMPVYRYDAHYREVMGVEALTMDKNAVLICPNPADYMITVKCDLPVIDHPALTIFNSSGKIVKSSLMNEQESQFNVSDLAVGIYMITVKSGNNTLTQKLIIKR